MNHKGKFYKVPQTSNREHPFLILYSHSWSFIVLKFSRLLWFAFMHFLMRNLLFCWASSKRIKIMWIFRFIYWKGGDFATVNECLLIHFKPAKLREFNLILSYKWLWKNMKSSRTSHLNSFRTNRITSLKCSPED